MSATARHLDLVRAAVARGSRAPLYGLIFESVVRLMTGLVILILFMMLATIIARGAPNMTWEFLSQPPRDMNTKGGIFPALFGTAFVVIFMIVMALPLGVLGAVYMAEYGGAGLLSRLSRAAVANLAAVPSIVFGLFGLGFFVLFIGRHLDVALFGEGGRHLFGQGAMFWAAATLAILVLPLVIVSTEESLRAVPASAREAAYALGATRWQVISRVVLPQARPGILTGAILAVARGAGELAPVLFVGVAAYMPDLPLTDPVNFGFFKMPVINPFDAFMHLNYHIYTLATQSPNPDSTRGVQFATTLVLVGLTVILNLAAIRMRQRYSGLQHK